MLRASRDRRHPCGPQRQRLRGRRHVVLLPARTAGRGRPGDPGLGGASRGLPGAPRGHDRPTAMSVPEPAPIPVARRRGGAHHHGRHASWRLRAPGLGAVRDRSAASGASSFLFIAIGLDAFGPGLVTWLRVLLGAAVLWLFARRAPPDRARGPAAPRGALGAVGRDPLHAVPSRRAADRSGLAGLVNGSLPLFVAAIALADAARVPRVARSAWASSWGSWASSRSPRRPGDERQRGHRRAAGAGARSLCYGVAVNIATPSTQRYGSLPVMARMLALAAIWTAPFGLWSLPESLVRVGLARRGGGARDVGTGSPSS